MKLFDKTAERAVWISILASIPLLLLVLWKYSGRLGLTEIIIVCFVLLLSISLLYGIKWYYNKD